MRGPEVGAGGPSPHTPEVFLALREMRRAKLRFALLTGAVGLLAFLVLFLQTLTGALIEQFIGALEHQSGQVVVFGEQARRNLEGSVVPADTVDAVAAVDGVAVAGPLGEGTFTVEADGELTDAVLFGYELGGPGAPTTLVEGRLPEAEGEAVAPSDADGEGFGIGDVVTVAPGGYQITVVGQADDIRFSVTPALFTSFDTYAAARRSVNPDAEAVPPSVVVADPVEGTTPEELARRIDDQVPGVDAVTRAVAVDSAPGVGPVQQSFSIIVFLCLFVVVVVAGLFFLILTVQKAGSLTLLRAIGTPTGDLVRSLLVQVVAVVVGGLVVGTLLLYGSLAGSGGGIGATVDPGLVLTNAVLILVLAVLASLAAVRRVLRIDPIRATVPGGATA